MNCPAFGKLCAKCKGRNHFAAVCKSNVVKKVNQIENESSDTSHSMSLYIDQVSREVHINECASLNLSPAQLMFGRRLKTKIPIHTKLLNPDIFNNVSERVLKRQDKQKQYYDKNASPLKPLSPGDNILALNFHNKKWETAKIISKCGSRSYMIENHLGNTVRINRIHLRPTNVPYQPTSDMNFDIPEVPNADCPMTTIHPHKSKPKTRSGRIIKTPRYLNNYVCH
ncbi:hypothetical protein JTE90_024442 [Oedothorax gibbosus]|uniref:Uncharacterized protein n=1 Tax=Oedothorax gibbosus TaxID=931172 RepID=A0AAV6UAX3_9ARAC|nr:hypothetical protein JTE90_024442 [Oedothorax gibbosus]